ncbi:hypothetical protein E4U53_002846 [Claviceps sorghi]|nr:hypothetical protein E4U53_002846 [Claviceps sorghi]
MSADADAAARRRASFAEGTRFEQLDAHTYRIHLHADFCIGAGRDANGKLRATVPNGGYAASCMLATANAHMRRLSSHGQPDTLTAHFEYIRKTAPGPGTVVIDEVKRGQQVSVLHLTLWQGEGEEEEEESVLDRAPWFVASSSRRKVLAYTTHVDLAALTGVSLPAGYSETAAAAMPAVPDFDRLRNAGTDGVWRRARVPTSSPIRRGSPENWLMFIPCHGALTPGVCDVWISATAGQTITQAALPYVVDTFPFELLDFFTAPGYFNPEDADELARRRRARGGLWFPTVVLNLEVKKLLPSQGVEWLNMRSTARQIRNGRMDIEVMVRDLAGELVALNSQVAMIMSMERNTGNGNGNGNGNGKKTLRHQKAVL